MEQLKIEKGNSKPAKGERFLIFIICLIAAIRVFVFSAAFPFFNNVDEQAHFDMVYKYSKGELPQKSLEKYDAEAVKIIADMGTTEYFQDFLAIPNEEQKKWVVSFFEDKNDRETWAWPSYYMTAGLWCRLGIILGLTGGKLLYWIKFLNIPVVFAFVWVSYLLARRVFGDNFQCRIAVTILAAVFPQDIFYAISNDALTPLLFALSFYMLLQIYLEEKSLRYHLITGLVIAFTVLAKASNNPIILLTAIVLLLKIRQMISQNRLKNYIPSLFVLCLALIIPVSYWLLRNYFVFGDIVGAAATMEDRGWTKKPLSEFFNHPILTWHGLIYFLAELTKTYWRGEFIWRTKRMAFEPMDIFYIISSLVFLVSSIIFYILNKSKADKPTRFVIPASLFVISASILFLAYSSMRVDFGECVYPSRELPYFTSGRLISGTIVPFLILYICGLRYILSKLGKANYLLLITILIAVSIMICEIALTIPVFSTPYNFYHLIQY